MAGVRYPIEMVNGVPVVAAPEEIDASNADCLRAVLLEAAARGHETFVVDPDPHPVLRLGPVSESWPGRTTAPWPKAASCGWSSPPAARFCACLRSPASTG